MISTSQSLGQLAHIAKAAFCCSARCLTHTPGQLVQIAKGVMMGDPAAPIASEMLV